MDSQYRPTPTEVLLEILSTRVPWSLGAKVVEQVGLHKSRGWADTIAAVRTRPPGDAAKERVEAALESFLRGHMLVGEKAVTWYDWKQNRDEVQSALKEWTTSIEPSELLSKPLNVLTVPFKQQALQSAIGKAPVLVDVRRAGSSLALVYFSARTYLSREHIDISQMPEAERERFEDYVEIIGMKARSLPCFDAVVFDPQKERVEIRMDRQKGMASEDEMSMASQIVEHANRILYRAIKNQPIGIGLVSFLPAVKRLYQDKKAGLVEYLGFVATAEAAASNNQGQTHRRKNQDLRLDPFHVGGKNAVRKIDPYKIGVSLDSVSGLGRLQLELNGSVRMITGSNSRGIAVAGFHGCADRKDFDAITTMLEEHLAARR